MSEKVTPGADPHHGSGAPDSVLELDTVPDQEAEPTATLDQLNESAGKNKLSARTNETSASL